MRLGIHADIIGCRSDYPIEEDHLKKIALFCDVDDEAVVPLPTVKSVYEIPTNLEKSGLGNYICEKLGLPCKTPKVNGWQKMLDNLHHLDGEVKIGIVAKYLANEDTYKSVNEAIQSACTANRKKAKIIWVDAEKIEKEGTKQLEGLDGIVVPGGFGHRGIEGKVIAARYARENKVPYLGLCLGMQIAVIEFARNIIGWKDANSGEFVQGGKHEVIHIMPEQRKNMDEANFGASMRLGAYPCVLDKKSKAFHLYGAEEISERHRHRYEFNNDHREEFVNKGLLFAGMSPDHHLVEIVEIPEHPFYVGVQFHPEFKSRPDRPHPLFAGFIEACLKEKTKELVK
jgi:CTP synthase